MKSKLHNIDLHTWHYHATSAILFGFSHGIMALGYFVQFLKEATLALLIHFFWRWNKLAKKIAFLLQRGQRELGWNEHIYSESIQRRNIKHQVRVPMWMEQANWSIWGLNSMSRSMLKTSWCFNKRVASWGGKGLFGHYKTAGYKKKLKHKK